VPELQAMLEPAEKLVGIVEFVEVAPGKVSLIVELLE
jgi:hypothetical protein